MTSIDRKMDVVVEAMLGALSSIDELSDDSFSPTLAAFTFVASVCMAEGWDDEELIEFIREEWLAHQEAMNDYRNSLN